MRKPNEIYLNGNNSTVQIALTHETSKIQVFNSPIFGKIRVSTDENGNPLFCLIDICTSIGIANHRNVKNRLDKDDVHLMDATDNLGRSQQLTFVSEGGMYDVILRSDSPKAKPFKKWVTGDVLPTIRKNGSYSVQPQLPQTYLEALKALVSSEEEKQLLELENRQLNEENERNLPKVEFAESIMQSPTCISVGEMANILKQNKLFNKGQNALYEYLRFNRYLLSRGGRRNLPSQKSINMGIMKIAENYSETERAIIINRKAVITPYGQKFFLELFRKRKEINGNMITLF